MGSRFRFSTAFSLVGVFVLENHCGNISIDHEKLALYLLENKHYERALIEAERAKREQNSASDPRVILALVHLGMGNIESAVDELQDAIRTNPNNQRLFETLREICLHEKRFDLAQNAFQNLIKDFPENSHIRTGLAWTYNKLEEYESALELLEDVIAQSDSLDTNVHHFALVQLGKIYLRQERFEQSVAVLDDALELIGDDVLILLLLGECRLRQGYEETAQKRFDDAITISTNPASTTSHIAQLYYGAGFDSQAIAYYERAVMNGEESPIILNNLAWTYAEKGVQLDRALELSLRAVKSNAENVVYLDTYAELLFLSQDYNRAIALIEQALEIEPPDGQHYDYLQRQLEKFRLPTGTVSAVPKEAL